MAKKIGVEALARILYTTVQACYSNCETEYHWDAPVFLADSLRKYVNIPDEYKESEFYNQTNSSMRNTYRDLARSIISGISYSEIVDARAKARAKPAKRKKGKKKG